MATLTVTSKGQITLRKELLAELGVGPGGKVAVDVVAPGRVELRAERPRTGKISDIFGMLHNPNQRSVSIEEMNDIIERGWAGEFADDP